MSIHDAWGNMPQKTPPTTNRTPAVSADTRYGPGEISRRLALCGLLINQKRQLIFAQAVDCMGVEARALGRDIAALGRLQRTWRRLHALAEYPASGSER